MAGRRALVTGGASGIGLATISRLLAEGARVVAVDRRAPRPDPRAVPAVPYLTADVSQPGQVTGAVREAADLLGGPADVLANAAGVYQVRPMLDLLIGADLPGAIVNVGSTAALVADAAEPTAHYNASKAGVLALTRQMAVEWAPHGIRANAVCPGVIDTPMLRLMDDPVAGHAYLETGVPLRRLGTADEVAAVIVFLASPDASYLTGAAVPVDGGSTAI